MTRSSIVALVAAATVATAPAVAHAQPVPVRIRVIKGSRQGPPSLDPRLKNQARQLSAIAYTRWELVEEKSLELAPGKTQFLALPAGDDVGVTLEERHGNTVTVEVALVARNTQSRLTVEKGKRIVHQVSPEQDGSAYFVTVLAWP
jgi:hypothetical protein